MKMVKRKKKEKKEERKNQSWYSSRGMKQIMEDEQSCSSAHNNYLFVSIVDTQDLVLLYDSQLRSTVLLPPMLVPMELKKKGGEKEEEEIHEVLGREVMDVHRYKCLERDKFHV
jgi:hypothetical protein